MFGAPCFLLPQFFLFLFLGGGRGGGAILLFPVNLSHLNLGDFIICSYGTIAIDILNSGY